MSILLMIQRKSTYFDNDIVNGLRITEQKKKKQKKQ